LRIKQNLDFSASGDFTANGNATAPRSPLTAKGMAKYAGILSINEIDEIVVSGALPRGNTTENVVYFIIGKPNRAIISQDVLPNASHQFNSVEMPLKVARAATGNEIGTFAPNGDFKPSEFLSVNSASNDQRPLGASGRNLRVLQPTIFFSSTKRKRRLAFVHL
jgi:hypothetical protein